MKTKILILILLIAFSMSHFFPKTNGILPKKIFEKLSQKRFLLENNMKELNRVKNIKSTKKDIEDLKDKIELLNSNINKISYEIKLLKKSVFLSNKKYNKLSDHFQTYKQINKTEIGHLKKTINSNTTKIKITAHKLDTKIGKTDRFVKLSIKRLSKMFSQITFHLIIAILVITLIFLIILILLKKQFLAQKISILNNFQKEIKFLEEKIVKLDNDLIKILETHLNLVSETNLKEPDKIDHTLALKIANEITRIQKNISKMNKNTKGIKQLEAAIKRIYANFSANGYEIVDLLGKSYNEGMKVSANFIIDETLEPGQQIITRIIKPQINYKGVMIQSAQIEVSIGK